MIDALHFTKHSQPSQPNAAELKAGQEFEAVMLTGFVEQMLPEDMGGTDTPQAGASVWRGFMAQAIASQMAQQSPSGLATLISNQLLQVREANDLGA